MASTIGQTAIKFALAAPKLASVLPNITNMPQLEEFATASEAADIPQDLLDRAYELYQNNFYLEPSAEPSAAD